MNSQKEQAMALSKFGFIVKGAGLDPAIHRTELKSSTFSMIAVGVSNIEEAPSVAAQMKAEGIELIELCGAFGPSATAAVSRVLGSDYPIGTVTYGPDAIDPMHKLFS
ncbi:MAG: hypothetical protein ACJA2X_001192 [Halocynthiibacter sp.]